MQFSLEPLIFSNMEKIKGARGCATTRSCSGLPLGAATATIMFLVTGSGISIQSLKEFAARKNSTVRVFGRLDIHFFSVNPAGEINAAALEMVPDEKMDAFFEDLLTNAEKFLVEGRFWKRELNRAELVRQLGIQS